MDRLYFLEGLQESTDFWSDLLSAIRNGITGGGLTGWMRQRHITDQWLADIVLETALRFSGILSECPEFNLSDLSGGTIKYELPTFFVPYKPFELNEEFQFRDGVVESVGEWELRLREQFNVQLAEKVKRWKALRGDDRTKAQFHGQWTAQRFTGSTFAEIARRAIKHRQLDNSQQPHVTVSTKVKAFATRIGLHLPQLT